MQFVARTTIKGTYRIKLVVSGYVSVKSSQQDHSHHTAQEQNYNYTVQNAEIGKILVICNIYQD